MRSRLAVLFGRLARSAWLRRPIEKQRGRGPAAAVCAAGPQPRRLGLRKAAMLLTGPGWWDERPGARTRAAPTAWSWVAGNGLRYVSRLAKRVLRPSARSGCVKIASALAV